MTTNAAQIDRPVTPLSTVPLDGHRLMNPRQAAELLAISARTLWTLTNRREIPSIRIGRCIRYLERDLVAWIQKHRVARR